MAGPWEKYRQGQPSPTMQPQTQSDPVIKRADPYRAEDQQMQRDAAARAAEDQARQAQQASISQANEAERLRMARDAAARQAQEATMGTESERTAGFLTKRVVDAIGRLGTAGTRDPAAQSPTLGVEATRKVAGDTAANYMTDAERQQVRAAQIDILDAALTLGTGAAYTREQIEGYREAYFPQLGDEPSTIASKRQALRSLLESAKIKAGRAAPDMEKAIAALDALDTVNDEETSLGEGPGEAVMGTVSDETPPDGLDPRFFDPGGAQGVMDLAKQGMTLGLSDEAAGVGGAISGFFTGEDPMDAYMRERDLERRNLEAARSAHPVMGTAAEFLGGGGAARIASLPSTLGSVMRQGAGIGAVGGFGYGEDAGSGVNALLGAAGGATIGAGLYGASKGLNALAQARRGSPPNMDVVTAGERQNIPIRQPDARPDMRNKMAQVETTQAGGPLIREARTADQAAIENRVAEVGGQGAVADPYALGNKVQDAGQRYIARTKAQANSLYNRAEQEAGGATVQPTEAVAAIERNIAELKAAGENSNKGQITYLEGLREDLSKPLSIKSVQNLRTNMRGQLSERGLTNTDAERRVGQVIDAANQDLTRELPQSASTALRAADDFYRNRQEFINGTLKQFMGDKGNLLPAETAASRLVSMTKGKGNFDRFSRMWKELEPSEQADIAATVAASLGRKGNGEFSASTLIRSLDPDSGINPRTARLLFGKDGADALADLRIIAKAKTDTGQAMNASRTGVVVGQTMGNLKTMLMAAFGFSTGGAGGAAAGAISREFLSRWGEQRAARMLLNPDFTKWLRNAPNTTNPRAIDRYFSRLAGTIAANDNQAFTQALIGAVRKSPGPAAAEQEPDARREPPQQ